MLDSLPAAKDEMVHPQRWYTAQDLQRADSVACLDRDIQKILIIDLDCMNPGCATDLKQGGSRRRGNCQENGFS